MGALIPTERRPVVQTRRDFLRAAGGAAVLLTAGGVPPLFAKSTPQSALVLDAMGEIRDVYSPELISEILGSGLNGITLTLCDPKTYEREAWDAAMDGIFSYNRYLRAHPDLFIQATRADHIGQARQSGRLAVFYLFQNSTQFGRDLDRVDTFHSLGVRSSQITYNHQNWAGAGCKERTGAGLTIFGQDLVAKMNEAGMLIDLSHASMQTMEDAIRASQVPVIVSHTACMEVFENERNTTDENLRLLAENGGVVGICQIRPFITTRREGAFDHYLDHIFHAIDVAGVDHVAIGSDRDHRVIEMSNEYIAELKAEEGPNFNEADWPLYMDELNGPRRMEAVWEGLGERGLNEADLEKVMGENIHRLYTEVLG
jgi:membrane dipeptidase